MKLIKIIIVSLLFVFSFSAFADWSLGLGYNTTTVNNLEKKLDIDNSVGAQFFYDWADLSFGLEGNYFHTSQREHELISMSLNYFELITWARYNFINKENFKLYIGSGVGGFQEEVKIDVVNNKRVKDKTEPQLLLPISVGASYRFHKKLKFGLEYRIIRQVKAEYENFSLRTSVNYIF